jgi:CBS domain-containing protein
MAQAQSANLMVTAVLRRRVLGPDGGVIGSIEDIIAHLAEGVYPEIRGLKVRVGGRDVFVSIASVSELSEAGARLAQPIANLAHFERRPGEVLLRDDVLGRRLINVSTGRLVRADDLALAYQDGHWWLVGLKPGAGRLFGGWLALGSRIAEAEAPSVDWGNVQPFVSHVPVAGLFMPLRVLQKLHPAQIADLVEQVSHAEGSEIIAAVEADPALAADVFEELDDPHREEFLVERSDAEIAQLLTNMEPDEAADALNELEQDRRRPVLELVPEPQQEKLLTLLQYHPATAGGTMSPDYIAVERGARQADVLAAVRDDQATPSPLCGTVFVTEHDGRLIGSVSLADAVRGDPALPVEDWPDLVTVRVHQSADVAEVAVRLTDYNLNAIGVTDANDRLIGAISVDDALEAMLPPEWRRRYEVS